MLRVREMGSKSLRVFRAAFSSQGASAEIAIHEDYFVGLVTWVLVHVLGYRGICLYSLRRLLVVQVCLFLPGISCRLRTA
jgi:hypothetical protein